MDYLFAGCSSLTSLQDISKWNSSAINKSYHVFSTKEAYGEMINVFFSFPNRSGIGIGVPTDMLIFELIKKINPCKL